MAIMTTTCNDDDEVNGTDNDNDYNHYIDNDKDNNNITLYISYIYIRLTEK